MSKKHKYLNDPVDDEQNTDPDISAELETSPTIPESHEKIESISESAPHPADLIALRVYATLAGPKWDQMAGFVSFARRQHLGPMTVEAWQAEYKKFQDKPIG